MALECRKIFWEGPQGILTKKEKNDFFDIFDQKNLFMDFVWNFQKSFLRKTQNFEEIKLKTWKKNFWKISKKFSKIF